MTEMTDCLCSFHSFIRIIYRFLGFFFLKKSIWLSICWKEKKNDMWLQHTSVPSSFLSVLSLNRSCLAAYTISMSSNYSFIEVNFTTHRRKFKNHCEIDRTDRFNSNTNKHQFTHYTHKLWRMDGRTDGCGWAKALLCTTIFFDRLLQIMPIIKIYFKFNGM